MTQFGLHIVIGLILLHFLADFVCQSQWMALNKCKNNSALSLHVLTYTVILGIGGFFILPYNKLILLLVWTVINGLLHFATDYLTSRATSKLWSLENKHWFFTMIGFDQCIHYTCLFATCLAIF